MTRLRHLGSGHHGERCYNDGGVVILSLCWLVLLVAATCLFAESGAFTLSEKLLDSVKHQHGEYAVRRLQAWERLINTDASESDSEKLHKVNVFFNRIRFVDDALHWKQQDYWATPVEFLATNGGDCEDFSLAKYFTLKALGVPEQRLNLTYVKALRLNQAHMVVTYYSSPDAEPLVLDNLVAQILPASKRADLLPVYSFNGAGLWLAKVRGKGQKVGGSDRLKRWQDLLRRMPEGMN